MDWRRYWTEYPRRFGETDFRRQVGRTASGGVPTPEEEVAVAVGEAVRRLDLGPEDRLLDLCCGNGYLTRRLADVALAVVGVDFSGPMVSIARRFHGGPGVDYREGSVLELERVLDADEPFDKACMLESLHYFEPDDAVPILRGLLACTTADGVLFFSGVTDVERKDNFFDTPERRREHERRKAEGTDVMGYWWHRDEIEAAAAAVGLRCEFLPQDPALVTASYRFDVVMTRG